MTFDDLLQEVLLFLPGAEIGEDNYGQLVIYTGMRIRPIKTEAGYREEIVPFDPDDEEAEDDGH